MQSKKINLNLNLNVKNSKIFTTFNNEAVISSYKIEEEQLKLYVYNLGLDIPKLQKPDYYSIQSQSNINCYEIIVKDNELSVFILIRDKLKKYILTATNDSSKLSPSGDNDLLKFFEISGIMSIPNTEPLSIKVSRNGVVLVISCSNGDIYVYGINTLFGSGEKSYKLIKSQEKFISFVRDISPDGTSLVTISNNVSRSMLWNIEKSSSIIELFHSDQSKIADCVFGRIEAVSHIYHIYAIYNSQDNKSKYWITMWNCSKYNIKKALCIEGKVSKSICCSNEGRYIAVYTDLIPTIDIFISFNLQKVYSHAYVTSDINYSCHFLPLSTSIEKLQHEFDFLSLYNDEQVGPCVQWLYEPMRYQYSAMWPILAAIVLIVAFFYSIVHFGI